MAGMVADTGCLMVNRNRGSGTRVLIDSLLRGVEPEGYHVQARSHNAVAAAIVQGRADWGVAIEYVARGQALGFIPLVDEEYDFVIPEPRMKKDAVQAFLSLLRSDKARQGLAGLGLNAFGFRAAL